MPKFPSLKVDKRTVVGRKVKQLRRQGLVPANVFGRQMESVAIQAPEQTVAKLYKEVGETGIVEVNVQDKKYPCLIAGVAMDTVSKKLLHVDFHHVSLKEKVTAAIPLEVVGESPAVKDMGGVLSQSLHEVEVEALPTELPESIEVDISMLQNIGDTITVGGLKVAGDIAVQAEPETVIVSVVEQQVEEEPETPTETETTEQGPTTEEASSAE